MLGEIATLRRSGVSAGSHPFDARVLEGVPRSSSVRGCRPAWCGTHAAEMRRSSAMTYVDTKERSGDE